MNERLLVFFEVRRVGNRKENWFGHVLYASGEIALRELQHIGRDWEEWGYIDNPRLTETCAMIWEGECLNANITHPEWEPRFSGKWRQPTAEELFSMLVTVDDLSTGKRGFMNGVELIAAERNRQIQQEGFDNGNDDRYVNFELQAAALCYLAPNFQSICWPQTWSRIWWKPTPCDRVRELVKAGALIAAEIDRLQRAAKPVDTESSATD